MYCMSEQTNVVGTLFCPQVNTVVHSARSEQCHPVFPMIRNKISTAPYKLSLIFKQKIILWGEGGFKKPPKLSYVINRQPPSNDTLYDIINALQHDFNSTMTKAFWLDIEVHYHARLHLLSNAWLSTIVQVIFWAFTDHLKNTRKSKLQDLNTISIFKNVTQQGKRVTGYNDIQNDVDQVQISSDRDEKKEVWIDQLLVLQNTSIVTQDMQFALVG